MHDGFLKIAVAVYWRPEWNFNPVVDQRRRRMSQRGVSEELVGTVLRHYDVDLPARDLRPLPRA